MQDMQRLKIDNSYLPAQKQDKELYLFFKKNINILLFFHTIFYYLKIFYRILIKKMVIFSNSRRLIYPGYLRKVFFKNSFQYKEGYLLELENKPEKIIETNFKSDINTPDWDQGFDDPEKLFYLHRWGWLLMEAVDNQSAELKNYGVAVIKDWFLSMNDKKTNPAWESYSVSERIANALIFFYVLRMFPAKSQMDIKFIEKNLLDMAIYLLGRLEFNFELTNNHLLNNARALYMIGRFSECNEIAEIGRLIFKNESSKMVTSSGFLNEGSSSYHFLILRTYLEVLWVARLSQDESFAVYIEPIAKSMVKAAWFFTVKNGSKWEIPFFGDISPDFPSSWLGNICRSKLALGLYNPSNCDLDDLSGWNKIWVGEKL